MRFLFVCLAIVVAVLAYLMGQPWLYGVAGVLLIAALGMLAAGWRRSHQKAQAPYRQRPPEDDLSALGIVEIRKKEKKTPPPRARSAPRPSEKHSSASPSTQEASSAKEAKLEARPAPPETAPRPAPRRNGASASGHTSSPTGGNGEATAEPRKAAAKPREAAAEPSVVEAYLRAVRAAIGARAVCLLVQEELALEYRVEAVAGPDRHVAPGTTFSTSAPLLSAARSRQAVAFAPVGEGSGGVPIQHLGYYAGAVPALRQVAFAPVPRQGTPATYFLVADAVDGFDERPARTLLERFARLLAVVLSVHAPEAEEAGARTYEAEAPGVEAPPRSEEPPAVEPPDDELADDEAEERETAQASGPRPRTDIIAEEMAEARAQGRELALALVYLNRAEDVAADGAEAVEAAEAALRERLEEAAPEARVERFGELTYGIFYSGSVAEVERWAVRLQEKLAHAEGWLEGGVSIGLAMLRDEHESPEALRAHAMSALQEAFTTGTCTILA